MLACSVSGGRAGLRNGLVAMLKTPPVMPASRMRGTSSWE